MVELPKYIVIPRQIIENPRIQYLDAKVYGVVCWFIRLSLKKCILSNSEFALLLNSKPKAISNAISTLVAEGCLTAVIDKRAGNVRELIPTIFVDLPIPTGVDTLSTQNGIAIPNQVDTYPPIGGHNNNNLKILETSEEVLASPVGDSAQPKAPKKPRKQLTAEEVALKELHRQQVDFVLLQFRTYRGFDPIEEPKDRRGVAWNMVQSVDKYIKLCDSKGRKIEFNEVVSLWFRWVSKQDWWAEVRKLKAVKVRFEEFSILLTRFLDGDKNAFKQSAALTDKSQVKNFEGQDVSAYANIQSVKSRGDSEVSELAGHS